MARKYLLVFPLLLVTGVIAFVNAQDPNRRLTSDNSFTPGILPVSGEESEIPPSRSVLRRPPQRTAGLGDRFQSTRKPSQGGGEGPGEIAIDTGDNSDSMPVATPLSAADAAGETPSVLKRKLTKSGTPSPRPAVSSNSYEPASTATANGSSRRPNSFPANTPSVPPTETNYDQPEEPQGVVVPSRSAPIAQPQVPSARPMSRPPQRAANAALLSGSGAALRIELNGPRAVVVNRPEAYSINLFNESDVPALSVAVRIALPPWAVVAATAATAGTAKMMEEPGTPGRFVWVIDQIEARAQHQLQLQIVAKESRPVGLSVDWVSLPIAATTEIEARQPSLEMTASGSKDALYGENLPYVITLSNPGNGDAENVNMKLIVGGGAPEIIPIGLIPAGKAKTIDVQVLASKAGPMRLHAEATADGGLVAEVNEQINVRRANLQLAMTGPKLLFAGSDGGFQLRVSNVGNATAEEVVASINLPTGAKITAITDGAKQSVNGVSWRVGALNPNTERVFEVRCELAAGGENQFAARVQGAGDLSAAETLGIMVQSLADLKLTINEPKGPRPVTEEVQYELLINNRGTKAAEQVSVEFFFSEGVEPVSVDGAAADLMPGKAAFKPIARIDAGQTVVLKVRAQADRPGNHRFRAEVLCPDPETRLLSEGTTRFFGEGGVPAPQRTSSVPAPSMAPKMAANVPPPITNQDSKVVAAKSTQPIATSVPGTSKKR